MRTFNPMTRIPGPCRCGQAPAARAEERINPANPQCHICRKIAAEHPELTDDQVAAAGRRRWAELEREAARSLSATLKGEVA